MNASQTGPAPKGYPSAEHKRKYTIMVGILGAVFFFGQMIMPLFIMIPMMPTILSESFVFQQRTAIVERGASWKNSLWFLEENLSGFPRENAQTQLTRLSIHQKAERETMAQISGGRPWLLSGTDKLWLISPSKVSVYQNDRITDLLDRKTLGDISAPFYYNGRPAVVEENPAGYALKVFEKGVWRLTANLHLHFRKKILDLSEDLRVLSHEGQTHWLARFGDSLYYRPDPPVLGRTSPDQWQPVVDVSGRWSATWLGDRPVVFIYESPDGISDSICGYRMGDGNWEKFVTHDGLLDVNWNIFAIGDNGRLALLSQFFPGALRLHMIEEGQVTRIRLVGGRSPFPQKMISMMAPIMLAPFIASVILAFILTVLMKKHRIVFYGTRLGGYPFASLGKRVAAQIIDGLYVLGPLVWIAFHQYHQILDFENFISNIEDAVFTHFGLFFLGSLWIILWLLLLSYLEGRWGITPGKWIMKIRVLGSDLAPCGFGRAVLRNILKFIDSFFGFMVGVIIIALTENWQRVGDLAARTVIVDIKGGFEGENDFEFS